MARDGELQTAQSDRTDGRTRIAVFPWEIRPRIVLGAGFAASRGVWSRWFFSGRSLPGTVDARFSAIRGDARSRSLTGSSHKIDTLKKGATGRRAKVIEMSA